MRGIWLVLAASCALSGGALIASSAGVPRGLVAAEEAYKSNVAIGDRLAGRPASMEQVADEEAVTQARRVVAENPGLAEAHRLLGLILCTGYRAAQVEAKQPQGSEGEKPKTVFVLARGGSDCQEGLEELRTAMKFHPAYQVDYAGALLICGDAAAAEEQARAAWKLSLPAPERADCARILAQIAQAGNRKQDEIRWLREVVKYDPQDAQASARLAKLAPPPASSANPKTAKAIAWVDYETGMVQAKKQKKPVLIDFSAEWCGWCKKLEKEVFPNRDVIAISQRFVCIKVDGDQRTDLTEKYRVDGYPTAVVLDYDGAELRRMEGYAPADEYLAELKAALAARQAK